MIFITAKCKVKAEHADAWADVTIVSQTIEQDDRSELGEMRVD